MPSFTVRARIAVAAAAVCGLLLVAVGDRGGPSSPVRTRGTAGPATTQVDETRSTSTEPGEPGAPSNPTDAPAADATTPAKVITAGALPLAATTTTTSTAAAGGQPEAVLATDLDRRILFNVEHGSASVGVDGSDRRSEVACPETPWGARPDAADVSPDGRWLARYCVDPVPMGPGWPRMDLVIQRIDGAGYRVLRVGAPNLTQPAWSPDGSRLAYVELNDIVIFRADGTKDRTLRFEYPVDEPWHGGFDRVSWSPDGTRLVLGNLYMVDVATGASRYPELHDVPFPDVDWRPEGRFSDARWSPDGRWIYATVEYWSSSSAIRMVVRVDPVTGDVEHLAQEDVDPDYISPVVFLPDDRVAYAVDGSLYAMEADGSHRMKVAQGLYTNVQLSTPLTN